MTAGDNAAAIMANRPVQGPLFCFYNSPRCGSRRMTFRNVFPDPVGTRWVRARDAFVKLAAAEGHQRHGVVVAVEASLHNDTSVPGREGMHIFMTAHGRCVGYTAARPQGTRA